MISNGYEGYGMIIYVLVYQQMQSWILKTRLFISVSKYDLKCDIIVSMVIM